MPFYDYECCKCRHVFEAQHGMLEKPLIVCEKCKKYTCSKLISTGIAGHSGNLEIWDSNEPKAAARYNAARGFPPPVLVSRDKKTKVRYDPTKHGHRKGVGR